MRAYEFVSEGKREVQVRGKVRHSHLEPTRGLHIFTDTNYDRIYSLNRVMMAAAMSDGVQRPVFDKESWAGKRNTAHPYTQIESEMLKHAYEAAGVEFNDLNNGDLTSRELDDTNVKSPIKSFKGYKK